MKSSIVLISLAAFISVSVAQKLIEGKGTKCKIIDDCKPGPLPCVDGYCGCKVGHRPELESHPQGTEQGQEPIYTCMKVVGYGCNKDQDCSEYLENAKCVSERCVCNKDDQCTDGAVTITVMSLTTLMGVSVALLKL